VADPTNPVILGEHIQCAAFEMAMTPAELTQVRTRLPPGLYHGAVLDQVA
jgi:ATP-dependent helicase YprA (DUF1998 family)